MPRVGSHEVDPDAAALIHSWIASMDNPSEYAARQKQVARQWSESNSAKAPSIELANPQIAIIVLDLIRSGEFSKQVSDAAIAAGLASVDPAIRDLFEGLVPASERVIRLGASFDRSAILTLKGDRERGRRVFAGSTTLCRNCHRIGNEGKAFGPDLTKLKSERMTTEFLLESILSPSKVIDQEYATYSVLTDEGIVIHGLQAPGTTDKQLVIQQLDGKTHTIARSSIEQMRKLPTSLMPDLLLKDLTAQEAADLLAYLASLSDAD